MAIQDPLAGRLSRTGGQPNSYPQLETIREQMSDDAYLGATQLVDEFIASLLELAKASAQENPEKLILISHVRQAREMMQKGTRKKAFVQKGGLFLLSAVFGVALPEFYRELGQLATPPHTGDTSLVIAWAVTALLTAVAAVYFVLTE